MWLHGVVILDWRGVGLVDDDRCFGERGRGVAAARGAASAFGRTGVLEQSVKVEFCGLLFVLDVEELCGLLGLGQRSGDDDGDGLAAVEDVGVLENVDVARDGEFWRVERCDDGVDAGGAGCCALIDGGDGSCGDGGLDDVSVGDVVDGELGCVFGATGYFGDAVVTMVELAGIEFGVGCFLSGDHAWTPCAARVSARTMLCLASSTLKALCS